MYISSSTYLPRLLYIHDMYIHVYLTKHQSMHTVHVFVCIYLFIYTHTLIHELT